VVDEAEGVGEAAETLVVGLHGQAGVVDHCVLRGEEDAG
jgi:hypothetical protein